MKVTPALVGVITLLTTFAGIVFAEDGARSTQSQFEWVSYDTGVRVLEKGAMVVPVYFKGSHHKLYAQLDTGSDATIFYGLVLRQWGIEVDSTNRALLEFSWTGERNVEACSSFVVWDQNEIVDTNSTAVDQRIVGTIGADAILGKILIIDFPHRNYSLVSDTSLISGKLKSTIQFAPTMLHNRRLWIMAMMGTDTLGWVLYDTGSSETLLSLPMKDWQRYTQRVGTEQDVERDSVPASGSYVQTVRARSQSDLIIGSVKLEKPVLEHTEFPDSDLNEWKILGNAAFYNDYIVIYDAKYLRFGIAPAKK